MSNNNREAKTVIERTYRAKVSEVWDLWTTKEGFESWWGPQGFRAEVHAIEPKVGGALRYDMIAATPEMVAAMKQQGWGVSHATTARFEELVRHERLRIRNVIDFLPGVEPYESDIEVDFKVAGEMVRMVVTLGGMHSTEMTKMQVEGFTSQLTKLDKRFM